MNLRRDLKLSLIKIIGLALGLGMQIMFTRVIGVKEYGIYILFTTWTSILSIILILGYDRIIIKQLGYYYIEKKKELFRSSLDKLIGRILINSTIFLAIAFFLPQHFLTQTFFSSDLLRSTWILIAVGTVGFTLFDLFGKVLSAMQKVELTYIRSEILYKLFLFFTVLFLFFFLRKIIGVNIIIAGVILAHVLTLLIFLFFTDRKKKSRYLSIKKEKVSLGRENYIFFFISLNYFALAQIDKIFIGKYESLETLGVYGLVSTLIIIASFSTIVYQRFYPKIFYYVSTNNIKGLEKDFKTVCSNSLLIALPFMMFIYIFTNDILQFFGDKFIGGTNILRILIWGPLVNFLTGPVGNILNNGKHSRVDLINSIVILIITIVLMFLGHNYFGVIGVAAATSFGIALINIVKVIEIRIFYKIFPYEVDNLWLIVLVFVSFYIIKLLNLNISQLLVRILINFSLSILMSALLITLWQALFHKEYYYKRILFNLSKFTRVK